VLVIGGGTDRPRGAFSGTRALLESGLFEAGGIRTICLAGAPKASARRLRPRPR
jgi:hypothetical protein